MLTAPAIYPPGTSRNFPDSPANFGPIHALLVAHCSECHSGDAEFPQSPYFASSDIDEAYEAAWAERTDLLRQEIVGRFKAA